MPYEGDLAELRTSIEQDYRREEPAALVPLLDEATAAPRLLTQVQALAARLAEGVRASRHEAGGVDALDARILARFARRHRAHVPRRSAAAHPGRRHARPPDPRQDRAGRLALARRAQSVAVRERRGVGACSSPASSSTRAATATLEQALASLLRKGGEPLIRKGVDLAMRLLGKQFVIGRTIDEALANAREREARGYRFSFDMLGEAALTDGRCAQLMSPRTRTRFTPSASRSRRRRCLWRPGHLDQAVRAASALLRAQRDRVMSELYPRVRSARSSSRAATTSASTSTPRKPTASSCRSTSSKRSRPIPRSPDGMAWASSSRHTRSARAPSSTGWSTLGRPHQRRLMVRLVKGAYWDTEIKRAQVDGLVGLSRLYAQGAHRRRRTWRARRRCWRRPTRIYPQFASHNAFTIAADSHAWRATCDYEFQCLHGMGESRSTTRSSAGKSGTAHAASTRPSDRTRRCSPTSCAACSRTAPTRRSSIVSSIRRQHRGARRGSGRARARNRRDAASAHPVAGGAIRDRNNSRGHRLLRRDALCALEAFLASRSRPHMRHRCWADASRSRRSGTRSPIPPTVATSSVPSTKQSGCRARGRACRRHRSAAWSGRRATRAPRCLERAADLIEEHARRSSRLAMREAGKIARQRAWRGARSCRLLPLLRRAGAPRASRDDAARHDGVHRPVEFPAGNLRRPGQRRACRGQSRAGEAGRADAADRGARPCASSIARACRALRCNCLPGAAKPSVRRSSPIRASPGVLFTGSTDVAQLINRTLA